MLDAFKRGQIYKRGAYFKANLLAIARRLYNALDLKFRVLGQRNSVLAIIGPQLAEQVVLVIGTSFSKIIIVILKAAIANASIIVLVLLIVTLQGNILKRFHEVSIRPLI
jgi:hypothetical protein